MSKDLILSNEEIKNISIQTKETIENVGEIFQLSTRFSTDNKLIDFKIFDKNKLTQLKNDMVIIDKKSHIFGRKNTQTTTTFMTLQMMCDRNPFRLLRQVIAQLEAKRPAIKEWFFKIAKFQAKLDLNQSLIDELESKNELSAREIYRLRCIKIECAEICTKISDGMIYTEGSLKEIACLQNSYKQICKNNNIPEEWDEKDFEDHELPFHIRRTFVNGIRDITVTGNHNHGTCEYMEQFGINPIEGYAFIRGFVSKCNKMIQNGENVTDELRDKFLDDMQEKYKDSYKYVLDKMGITDFIDKESQYREEPNL